MATKVTAKSMRNMAEEYGFALAFFNSDPEILKLFKTAVGAGWEPQKFTARLQGTKWFKTHSSAYRNNIAQKTSDPATWKSRIAQSIASLGDQARSMGATLSSAQLSSLADHALLLGYTDSQIKNSLAQYVKLNQAGNYFGQAGADAQSLKQSAFRNGINVSDQTMQKWVTSIEAGDQTSDDYVSWIRDQAKTIAPGLSKQLEAGMDLADAASPYVQSMSSLLELNPSDVTMFDPTIRKALNTRDKDGASSTMTLGGFEDQLRGDPRWMKTNNARDAFSQSAHGILSQFGFLS